MSIVNYTTSRVSCACGNGFTTKSTRAELKVELCNVCHPFYTGKSRIVDTRGRVERFARRYAKRSRVATTTR